MALWSVTDLAIFICAIREQHCSLRVYGNFPFMPLGALHYITILVISGTTVLLPKTEFNISKIRGAQNVISKEFLSNKVQLLHSVTVWKQILKLSETCRMHL